MWKVKMHVILVKDGCRVALKTKIRNHKIATANLLLALNDKMLFNVQTTHTITKDFWGGLHKVSP